jgi:hypothetical protein
MEIVMEAATYTPIQNQVGQYVDKIPQIVAEVGIKCPCNNHKMKYKTSGSFIAHTKTLGHGKWLDELNANRHNFISENAELRETVRTQQTIITQMDIQLRNKETCISELLGIIEKMRRSAATDSPKAEPNDVQDLLYFSPID